MSPVIRGVDLLHIGAAGALASVPFVPYVAVGSQPYAAIGLIERINALLETQIVDGGWRVPPILALITSLSAVVLIALPRTHRSKGHVAAALLAAASAVMTYRFTGHSVLLHPLVGPKLLVLGAVLSLGAAIWEMVVIRNDVRDVVVP